MEQKICKVCGGELKEDMVYCMKDYHGNYSVPTLKGYYCEDCGILYKHLPRDQ